MIAASRMEHALRLNPIETIQGWRGHQDTSDRGARPYCGYVPFAPAAEYLLFPTLTMDGEQ